MQWSRDDRGASSPVAFLIAGSIFLASVGSVLYVTHDAARNADAGDAATDQMDAVSLLNLLTESQGVGWEKGADSLDRFGLGAANGTGMQLENIQSMRVFGDSPNDGNGIVDYEEARASLGLDEAGLDFHLRIEPVWVDVRNRSLANETPRLGYLGDFDPVATVVVQFDDEDAMVEEARARLDARATRTAHDERRFVAAAADTDFSDRFHITTLAPEILVEVAPGVQVPLFTLVNKTLFAGDVYPDDADYLKQVLPGRMSEYDIFIVGSGVADMALQPASVKKALRDWVHDGGTLVLLGNSEPSQWTQSAFGFKSKAAAGAVGAPTANHLMLSGPERLEWGEFPGTGYAWDLGDDDVYVERAESPPDAQEGPLCSLCEGGAGGGLGNGTGGGSGNGSAGAGNSTSGGGYSFGREDEGHYWGEITLQSQQVKRVDGWNVGGVSLSVGAAADAPGDDEEEAVVPKGAFDRSLVRDGMAVMAVSKSGVYGDGRIALANYDLSEVADQAGDAQAQAVLGNLLAYLEVERSGLVLDFGAEIPLDRPVSAAMGQSHVWDPVEGHVSMNMMVHVWRR